MEQTREELASRLADAKRAEDQAKAVRVQAEADLAADLLADCPEEGSKTFTIGEFKAVVKRAFNYKADCARIRACGIDPAIMPIKVKEELDERGYRWLAEHDSQAFAVVSEFVTRTPAKVSVSLERKEKL